MRQKCQGNHNGSLKLASIEELSHPGRINDRNSERSFRKREQFDSLIPEGIKKYIYVVIFFAVSGLQ